MLGAWRGQPSSPHPVVGVSAVVVVDDLDEVHGSISGVFPELLRHGGEPLRIVKGQDYVRIPVICSNPRGSEGESLTNPQLVQPFLEAPLLMVAVITSDDVPIGSVQSDGRYRS